MRSASRDSMAYQQQYEERFPVEREQARQLRVAPTPRRRKRAGIRPSVMGCVMVLAVTAVYILFCQMQLTELSAAVGEQNDRLNELSAENVSLTTKQMNSMNMDEVEEYAVNNLGMVKMDNSQIEYVGDQSGYRDGGGQWYVAWIAVCRAGTQLFRDRGIYPVRQ